MGRKVFIPFIKPWHDLKWCKKWVNACSRKNFTTKSITKILGLRRWRAYATLLIIWNLFIFCSFLFSCILYSTQVLRVIAFILEFCLYEHAFERLRFCVRHYWCYRENEVELRFILNYMLVLLIWCLENAVCITKAVGTRYNFFSRSQYNFCFLLRCQREGKLQRVLCPRHWP